MNKPEPPSSEAHKRPSDAQDPGRETREDSEDKELVERAVEGDAQAFERLFTKYRQRLFGVAWRVLRNEDAALDVVQDAFVKAYERLGKLRGESSFYPWIKRITVNQAIDRLRHIRRGVEVGFDEAQFGGGDEVDDDRVQVRPSDRTERENPERKAQLSEFGGALEKALEKLTEAHRTVFLLHAAEDMSYREIADAMGCQIGTVMSRLFYARKKLQELLGSHLADER